MQNVSLFSIRQDIEVLIPKVNFLLIYISQQKEEQYKHLKEAFDNRGNSSVDLISADNLLATLGQTYRYDQLRKVQILVEELYDTICRIDDFPNSISQIVSAD
ncbi:MAG: hypothetical protein LBT05_09225 [Planctomycetaceae bacterium]|jgi:hypothetical protein|nr:hypothetical protein [Planctomycetaceae bacterium]